MTQFLYVMVQLLQLILALGVLVFVHELGHFTFARLFGVRVEKFFLFFDTKGVALWRCKSKKSGTEFGIGWLPLGGYCKIAGMVDEHYLQTGERTAPKSDEMRAKPAWQRILIMLGGILFNLLFAIIIYAGITYSRGEYLLPSDHLSSGMMFSKEAHSVGFEDGDIILSVDGVHSPNIFESNFMQSVVEAEQVSVQRLGQTVTLHMPSGLLQKVIASKEPFMSVIVPFVVDSLLPGGVAEKASLRKGDQLLRLDTLEIADIADAQYYFALHPNATIAATLLRGSDTLHLPLRPDASGKIGVVLRTLDKLYPPRHIRYTFWESLPRGAQLAFSTLKGYASSMRLVFSREGASQVGGFITMGKLFSGLFDWIAFWNIVALLSIVFAFMNFLPIPMLDGAEILFLLVELISRRKIDEKVIMKTKMVGLVLLLLLFVWANMNDIFRLF